MEQFAKVNASIRDRFRYALPYPIAINYKRIGACPDANASRLMYILKTSEMIVRLLGIVALGDLRRSFAGSKVPDGELRAEFKRRFASPSFGTWLWILRESIRTIDSSGKPLFLKALKAFCFDEKGKPSSTIRALDELLVLRNRFIHDKVAPDEWLQPRQIPSACETGLPRLEQVLCDLLFLADFPIVVVTPIQVEKKRDSHPTYIKDTFVISGCSDQFDVEREASDQLCESGEVLLLDRESGQYVNLDPFVLYSNEGEDVRAAPDGSNVTVATNISDVFLYNGMSGKHCAYLACNKGGELASNRSSKQDYIESGLAEFVKMFEPTGGGAS